MSDFMDRDTLELVQETAVKAADAKGKVAVVELPKEPLHVYGIVKSDGSFERIEAAPALRRHKLLSIDQVGDFVAETRDRLHTNPTVWYSPAGVSIVLSDGPDRNVLGWADVPLTFTPQYLLLRELEKGKQFSQKQFVRLLRSQLSDCMTSGLSELLRSVRVLNFREQTTGRGSVGVGRESLGQEIEAEVTSAISALPEDDVIADVRIFTDPSLILRRPIRCVLDVDAAEMWLSLTPLPMELDQAVQSEMEHLEQMLESATDAPVFYGVP